MSTLSTTPCRLGHVSRFPVQYFCILSQTPTLQPSILQPSASTITFSLPKYQSIQIYHHCSRINSHHSFNTTHSHIPHTLQRLTHPDLAPHSSFLSRAAAPSTPCIRQHLSQTHSSASYAPSNIQTSMFQSTKPPLSSHSFSRLKYPLLLRPTPSLMKKQQAT